MTESAPPSLPQDPARLNGFIREALNWVGYGWSTDDTYAWFGDQPLRFFERLGQSNQSIPLLCGSTVTVPSLGDRPVTRPVILENRPPYEGGRSGGLCQILDGIPYLPVVVQLAEYSNTSAWETREGHVRLDEFVRAHALVPLSGTGLVYPGWEDMGSRPPNQEYGTSHKLHVPLRYWRFGQGSTTAPIGSTVEVLVQDGGVIAVMIRLAGDYINGAVVEESFNSTLRENKLEARIETTAAVAGGLFSLLKMFFRDITR